MSTVFEGVNYKLGFGCMRLPMQKRKKIDYEEFSKMVDYFLNSGFNYFDTAHSYMRGQSEVALRECLTKRYDRSKYILANKLTTLNFEKEEDILPLFESQLESCGVTYFDYYLMHSQSADIFKKYKKCRAYEVALKLKEMGRIRHFGISFHDRAEVLERIIQEYPQIEVVQIQFNYVDYENAAVQSRKCYEVCQKYGKPVIVMEPCKGGSLVRLPADAQAILNNLNNESPASYALRFAAGFENVYMVLSGMSNIHQIKENTSLMKNFVPLSSREYEAIKSVCKIFSEKDFIQCTACRYCVDQCPQNISIPDLFACLNAKRQFHNWNQDYYYNIAYTSSGGKASSCICCGNCEKICPQHLSIHELLGVVAEEFEKKR